MGFNFGIQVKENILTIQKNIFIATYLISKYLLFIKVAFLSFICSVGITNNLIAERRVLEWDTIYQDHIKFAGLSFISNSEVPYYVETFYFSSPVKFEINQFNIKHISGRKFGISLPDTVTWKILSGQTRGKYFYQLVLLPALKLADGNVGIVTEFNIDIKPLGKVLYQGKTFNTLQYTTNSVLSSGRWCKIKIFEDGLYRITYSQLKSWGFTNMSKIQVYGNGGGMLPVSTQFPRKDDLTRVPIYVDKGSDGVFNEGDYILFYAQGPHIWKFNPSNRRFYHQKHQYSNFNCYFITDGGELTTEITRAPYKPSLSNVMEINTFDDFHFFESDEVNLLHSGSTWYGNVLSNQTTRTFTTDFPNIDNTQPVFVYYDILSVADNPGSFAFSLGNINFTKSTKNSSNNNYYPVRDTFLITIPGSSFKLNITYRNSLSLGALGYINYIGVNVARKLIFTGTPLIIRNRNTYRSGKTVKYIVESIDKNIMVWDVTDVTAPVNVETAIENSNVIFYAPSDTLRQFLIFSKKSSFLSVDAAEIVPNQNIHGQAVPDMVIVSPSDSGILEQAKRLANFRRTNDNLDVLVVTIQQVYNEFSSGVRDVSAIRDMVKMFYERDPKKMKYLLLFGKGTYANNFDNPNNFNLIPTYQSAESLNEGSSYVTDDFFGWMNWNVYETENLIDVGVGRLPVKNAYEAKNVVDKLINYVNPRNDGDWKSIITFIGDDEDLNIHVNQSDELANMVEKKYPNFWIRKIYLDAYEQVSTSIGDRYPEANKALDNQINTGTLIVNYTGHGSPIQLAHEDMVDIAIIRSWKNYDRLPLFVTATCSFGRFDDVDLQELKTTTSAGEEILLNPTGGAVGLLTTTRLVYATDNFVLNRAFYNNVFKRDENGNYLRLGDIFRLTKNDAFYTGLNRLNFTLLGDPSMVLEYPKQNFIHVDSLYSNNSRMDTIRALDLVTVRGHYADDNNQLIPFNGIQYVTVFDKVDSLTTLANDVESLPKSFSQWQNIIFRGKVEVVNGQFEFQFPVPRDIRYNMGKGKMIFYASSSYPMSYGGFFNDFIVGGVSQRPIDDTTGPQIRLFMNDTNFVNGGITDPNPRLIIHLFDENGINATGIGIGHDISATLDDNSQQMYILNDYYQSDLNDYRKGKVVFPFTGLKPGEHLIKVVAYDIYNNYSEAYLSFRVKSDEEMVIDRVHNFPNPMNDYTSFVIEHNWPGKEVTLDIYIFSFTGSMVNKLQYKGVFEGYSTPPIRWYGNDGTGHKAGSGMYLYKVIMKDKDGNSAENFGKLLIVR